jgi:hypothetical protein
LHFAPGEHEVYRYWGYGLGIHSEAPLPELSQQESPRDITIRFASCARKPSAAANTHFQAWRIDGGIALCWLDIGSFEVRNGADIVVEPVSTCSAEQLRLILLGPVLAVLLQQRGLLVLHASAVNTDSGVAAFLGWKGWGKSTLAARMHAMGHTLVSDDLLAVMLDAPPSVHMGILQLKLWPDAAAAVGRNAAELPRLHPDYEKRGLRLDQGGPRRAAHLSHVYVLGFGNQLAIERIQLGEALLQLLPHWYCGRFGEPVSSALGKATPLVQCAELVRQVPVFLLTRPSSLAMLEETALAVRRHSTQPGAIPAAEDAATAATISRTEVL